MEVTSSSADLGVAVGDISSTKITINNDESQLNEMLCDDVILHHYRSL